MAAPSPAPESGALSQAERQWRAAVGLAWPLALAATPLLLSFDQVPLCAFRELSGLPCPLCGGTHACAALLQGDLLAAWEANPGVLFVLALAAAHSGALAIEALSGRRFGTRRRWSQAWAGAGGLLVVTWGLRLLGYL